MESIGLARSNRLVNQAWCELAVPTEVKTDTTVLIDPPIGAPLENAGVTPSGLVES